MVFSRLQFAVHPAERFDAPMLDVDDPSTLDAVASGADSGGKERVNTKRNQLKHVHVYRLWPRLPIVPIKHGSNFRHHQVLSDLRPLHVL